MKLSNRNFVAKLSDSDIRLLRIFCTVTRCGGFAAAESELQLGLPSISRYIKSLEIRLGVRLCRRGRTGFALTEQGRKVYAASLRLIADLERFEGDIRSLHAELTGTLNLGVIDTLITERNLQIPDLIRSYKTRYPQVELNIVTATSNVIEQSVLDGNVHVGIVHARRHLSRLNYRFLCQERCNLYAAHDHPLVSRPATTLRAEDVYEYDFAGFSYIDDAEQGAGSRLAKTASVDCMEALATLISTGCFIGFLPDHYVQSVWRLKQFRPILPEIFSYSVDIDFVTQSATTSPLVLALQDHLERIELQRSQSARPVKAALVAVPGN
jgi:LysR family transcriptional regulator, transcriptional activator for bauABCD operon